MVTTLTGHDAPSYAEFARAAGIPLGSVGPTRIRYLRKLRRSLEESGLGAHCWS
jgi:DNA-directed RNA polymerase specialized sigma24 family protein